VSSLYGARVYIQDAKSVILRLSTLRLITTLLSIVVASGCASGVPKRAAIPLDKLDQAMLTGHSNNIRGLGLRTSPELQEDFVDGLVDGGPEHACEFKDGDPVMCVLVISGGGGWGAFGAGVLNGWSEQGDRPNFKIVTGISTGALIAPFAFLGPEYDSVLKEAFTTIEGESDLFTRRSIFALFSSDSVASNAPLKRRLDAAISPTVVEAIADAHRDGRRLYIGTTNLDAQRFSIWNIGAIAVNGDIDLIRKVILASTAIPGVMPPVSFEANIDGVTYEELHSDGGLQAQFFIPLNVVDLKAAIMSAKARGFEGTPRPKLFVIRNARFIPDPEQVRRRLLPIVQRSLTTMTQAMGRSDLYQIFAISRARGSDLLYAEVPETFSWESKDQFDGGEMRRLYDIGVNFGKDDASWKTTPLGLFTKNAGFE